MITNTLLVTFRNNYNKGIILSKKLKVHISRRWYPNPGPFIEASIRITNPTTSEIHNACRALMILQPRVITTVGFLRFNNNPYYFAFPLTKPYDNNLKPIIPNSEGTVQKSNIFTDPKLLEELINGMKAQNIPEEIIKQSINEIKLIIGGEDRIMALDYVLRRYIPITDQYYIAFKEILKELSLIQKDKDVLAMAKYYAGLLETLKKYLEYTLPQTEGPYMSTSYQEYLRLMDHTDANNIERKKDFYDFIKTERITRCFFSEEFKDQIIQNEKALKILNDPNIEALSEKEVIALFNRLGIITYPDALYNTPLNAVNIEGKLMQDTYIQEEGEGPKIKAKVYTVLIKDNYISTKGGLLSEADITSVVQTIKDNKVIVGTITSDPSKETLVLSGKRLHLTIAIQDPCNKDSYLIVGNLTSAGEDTIVLSKQQHYLEESTPDGTTLLTLRDKEQRFLLSKIFVRISKDEYKENAKGTGYLQGNDEEGFSIMQKVVDSFLKNKEVICNQPVESLKEFTLKQLLDSAKYFLQKETQQLQGDLNMLVTKLSKMNEEKLQETLQRIKSQRTNWLKEVKKKKYYEGLTSKEQVLYNLYDKLVEIKKRSKEIIKKTTDKDHIETMKAKRMTEREQDQQEYHYNNMQGD